MIVLAMKPVKGMKTIEAKILKKVCAFAICLGIFWEVWETKSAKVGIQKQKTIVGSPPEESKKKKQNSKFRSTRHRNV